MAAYHECGVCGGRIYLAEERWHIRRSDWEKEKVLHPRCIQALFAASTCICGTEVEQPGLCPDCWDQMGDDMARNGRLRERRVK